MILQELCNYYQRKAAEPESNMAPEGFEWKDIPFLIVIDQQGKFVEIQDTREGEGRVRRAKTFLVPQAVKRSVNISSNLLWDTVEYALGANPRGRSDIGARHDAFKAKLAELSQESIEVQALLAFLASDPIGQIQTTPAAESLWAEIMEGKANLTFRLDASSHMTLCDALLDRLMRTRLGAHPDGFCLVTGEPAPIARIHPSISGVRGAQSSGANLISFNLDAFTSFGKKQNRNAPVGDASVFAYTAALNHLLAKDSKQKIQIGDTTTVFWADRADALESQFGDIFGFPAKDDPDRETQAVKAVYEGIHAGHAGAGSGGEFFVLGLAPNASRLSVRFWIADSIRSLSMKLRQHLEDLEIVLPPKDSGHRALMLLLCDLVLERKAENLPPNLAGAVVRSALTGGRYPQPLLHLAVRRIRAERVVTRIRAALLKAVLNRSQRLNSSLEKEITVSLDPSNINPGYRLGRLFAVLEKIQEDAQKGINTTIRGRFYGAASSSPASVFPQLFKLKNHHLAKLDNPSFRTAHEKRLAEIFDGISDMPAHLRLEDQARFAIGYYHQRQALFAKNSNPDPTQA